MSHRDTLNARNAASQFSAARLRPLAIALLLSGLSLLTFFTALKAGSPIELRGRLATVDMTVVENKSGSSLMVSPDSLTSTQPVDTLITRTLFLTNTSGMIVNWAIGRTPIAIYENGPLVNLPGGGPNGADASEVQFLSLGMTGLGYGNSVAADNRIADEFTIPGPDGWLLDTITFYAYQTGSLLNSTMTAVNYRIWDGPPNVITSNVIFGDITTNRLLNTTWSGIYRTSDNPTTPRDIRPIMANTVHAQTYLPPGIYWLDWQTDGTLSSGPWAPPITINNVLTTGNGLQFEGGSWVNVNDGGTGAPQGFPFDIENCTVPSWITVQTAGGSLAGGAAEQIAITFDSTGLAAGTYSGELCVADIDAATPFIRVPLTLTNLTPAIAFAATIGIDPTECSVSNTLFTSSAADIYYCYKVTNTGYTTLTLHDLVDSQFGSILSGFSAALAPGDSLDSVTAGLTFSATITTTTQTTATWTAYNPGPTDVAIFTDTTAILFRTPDITLSTTVGTDAHGCADTSNLTVGIGTDVYYCYRVTNMGDVPLTLHDLADSEFGSILSDYTFTLAPGATFNTVAAGITRTAHIVTDTVNTAVWTARNGPLISITDTNSTTVTAIQLYPILIPFIQRP